MKSAKLSIFFGTLAAMMVMTNAHSLPDVPGRAPLSAVGTCPERDGSIPVYLPDSDRCDIYYECSGGVPIQNECPPDLEWNTNKNTCDFSIDAGCSAGRSPLSAVGTCPERDGSIPVYLPDSDRCDIYYECSGGVPIQNDCPPDLEWNSNKNTCDFSIDAGCSAGRAPLSAVGTCPERDGSIPVYLPDSDRCDIYYECSGGVPIQNECPPDLEWNTNKNTCDFPIDAGCSAGTASPL